MVHIGNLPGSSRLVHLLNQVIKSVNFQNFRVEFLLLRAELGSNKPFENWNIINVQFFQKLLFNTCDEILFNEVTLAEVVIVDNGNDNRFT